MKKKISLIEIEKISLAAYYFFLLEDIFAKIFLVKAPLLTLFKMKLIRAK